MSALKVDELDYIHFLIAAQDVFTATETARIREGAPGTKAWPHKRLLKCIPPDSETLWQEVVSSV